MVLLQEENCDLYKGVQVIFYLTHIHKLPFKGTKIYKI